MNILQPHLNSIYGRFLFKSCSLKTPSDITPLLTYCLPCPEPGVDGDEPGEAVEDHHIEAAGFPNSGGRGAQPPDQHEQSHNRNRTVFSCMTI